MNSKPSDELEKKIQNHFRLSDQGPEFPQGLAREAARVLGGSPAQTPKAGKTWPVWVPLLATAAALLAALFPLREKFWQAEDSKTTHEHLSASKPDEEKAKPIFPEVIVQPFMEKAVFKGVVFGFDGNPLKDAEVWNITFSGGSWDRKQTKTNEKGEYTLEADRAIGGIEVRIVERVGNGTKMGFTKYIMHQVKGPFYKSQNIDIHLKEAPIVKIQGNVKDENGKPWANGKLWADIPNARFPMMTNETGDYCCETTTPVSAVSVEISQNNEYYFAKPRAKSDSVDYDLSKIKRFKIEGKVTDGAGNPKGDHFVMLYGDDGRQISNRFQTKKDGAYCLYATEKATGIYVFGNNIPATIMKEGVWEKDSEMDIDLSKIPMRQMRGKVTDTDGKPLAGAKLSALDSQFGFGLSFFKDGRPVEAKTDSEGKFDFMVSNTIGKIRIMIGKSHSPDLVYFDSEIPKNHGDEEELQLFQDPAKTAGGFCIRGTLNSGDGKGMVGARIHAFNENGQYAGSAKTDGDGNFELMFRGKKAEYLQINPSERSAVIILIPGPWTKNAEVKYVCEREIK